MNKILENVSPFQKYRHEIFGEYSAAYFIRSVILSLYNGKVYKIPLNKIANLDSHHFKIFNEIISDYRQFGESNALLDIVDEILSSLSRKQLLINDDKSIPF